MKYLGNIPAGQTISFLFSTNDGSGAAVAPTTAGTVSVYKDDSTTETTVGVTYAPSFDNIIGVNLVKIPTADAFYAAGHDFTVILNGAVIDAETVNVVLAGFSIEHRGVVQSIDAGSSAFAQKTAKEALGVAGVVWHASALGDDSTGLDWATAKHSAKTAIESGNADDLVKLGAETFALGANGITAAAGVSIEGSGMDQTIISSTSNGTKIVSLAAGGRLRNLTVKGLMNDGTYQYPVSITDGCLCENVRTIGDSDGFWGGTVASGCWARLVNCHVSSKWDTLNIEINGTLEIDGGEYCAIGPTACTEFGAPAAYSTGLTLTGTGVAYIRKALLIARQGGGHTYGATLSSLTIVFEGCDIMAEDTGNYTVVGIYNNGSATIYMFGGSIRTANGNNTDLAVLNEGSGKIVLIGVDYDRTKTSNTGTGSILDIPVHAVGKDGAEIAANLTKLLGTAIPAESATGRDAAALGKLLDVATPANTVNDLATAAAIVEVAANVAETLATVGVTGAALTADERNSIADALLSRANVVDGKTFQQALRYAAAVLAGKVRGVNTGTETFTGLDGATDRVRVTVDAAGDRSAVEYDPAS